jgi:hypothetical protein
MRIAALILIVGAVAWMAAPSASADTGVGTWQMTGSQLAGHPDERVATLANGRVLVMHAHDEEVTPDPRDLYRTRHDRTLRTGFGNVDTGAASLPETGKP